MLSRRTSLCFCLAGAEGFPAGFAHVRWAPDGRHRGADAVLQVPRGAVTFIFQLYESSSFFGRRLGVCHHSHLLVKVNSVVGALNACARVCRVGAIRGTTSALAGLSCRCDGSVEC